MIPTQMSFINFSKFHEFVFFNSKFSAKSSVSPYIFHTKKAILDTYFEIALVSLQSWWDMIFFHINILGIPWILHIAKIEKNSRSWFFKPQPARVFISLLQILQTPVESEASSWPCTVATRAYAVIMVWKILDPVHIDKNF